MRNIVFFSVLLVVVFSITTQSIAAGPDEGGPGPRSRILGGAIADPSDWSTIYWNAAGLMKLKEKRVGFAVNAGWMRRRSSDSLLNIFTPDIRKGEFQKIYSNEPDSFHRNSVRAFSLTTQFALTYNAKYFAIGAMNMPAVAFDTNFHDQVNTPSGDAIYGEYISQTYVSSLPVAAASPIGKDMSVGATVHFRYGTRTRNQVKTYLPSGVSSPYASYYSNREATLFGYGASIDISFLYTPEKGTKFGVVLRSPYKFRYSGIVKYTNTLIGTARESDVLTRMYYPMQIDVGMAQDLSNSVALNLDLRYTGWETLRFTTNFRDNQDSFLDEREDPDMSKTIDIGVGFQYKVSDSLSLIAGARYEPSPYGRVHASLITDNFASCVALGFGLDYRIQKTRVQVGIIDKQYERRHHAGNAYSQDDIQLGFLMEIMF